jgi:hypothetical protein
MIHREEGFFVAAKQIKTVHDLVRVSLIINTSYSISLSSLRHPITSISVAFFFFYLAFLPFCPRVSHVAIHHLLQQN